jgi:hypothetical protein
MKSKFSIPVVLCFFFGVISCSKDDEPKDCSELNATYSKDIAAIFNQSCATSGCHTSSEAAGGYILDNYINSRVAALSGRLIGSVNHQNGFSPMPQGSGKLSVANIQLINCWVEAGAPQ